MLNSISIEDLLNEVEQMEQSGDHDRARMASISIHILKRTGNRLSALMDDRDAKRQACDTCKENRRCEPYPFDFIGMKPVCGSCRDAHEEERREEELEQEAEEREDYEW